MTGSSQTMPTIATAEPVLAIENLRVSYATSSGEFVAVDGVSIDVKPGEIVGLVGESGAGKSTVGSAVAKLIDYPGSISGGSVTLRGVGNLVPLDEREMCSVRGRRIGMIFQDALSALLPVKTVGAQLIRAIRLAKGVSHAEARQRALALLEEVGISNPSARMRQYPHQFSGGMRQRIVIAIALAGDPGLLIADEPTTALDVSIQSEILRLLKRLANDHQAGVILITHDMAVIQEVTDRVAVMRHGRLIEFGPTAAVLSAPREEYTKALIAAVPRADKRLERFAVLDNGSSEQFEIARQRPAEPPPRPTDGAPLLSVRDVDISFTVKKSLFPSRREYVKAAQSVSLDVAVGESIGIVGESGSGKSTLARAICGLQPIDGGTITFMGKSIAELKSDRSLRRLRIGSQMIFQDPFSSLNPRQRIGSALAEPMLVNGLADRDQAYETARQTLIRVGLKASDTTKLPHQFSGGQRQRICIARALMMQPTMLICDEPTSALDVSVQATILNLLKDLQEERGLTLVFISHDLAVIRQMCDRVVVMQGGRVCETAETETLFVSPQDPYTRKLLNIMPKFTSGARAPN